MIRTMKLYQVDAFTNKLFSGNPAAVCILEQWIGEELMQAIAFENNLAETAFVVPHDEDFEIRWFTPEAEVELCGHATLAASFVLFNIYHYHNSLLKFNSLFSGWLSVEKKGDMLFLDFPTDELKKIDNEEKYKMIEDCIGIKPKEIYLGKTDYIAIIDNEKEVRELKPNLPAISKIDARGLIVSSVGATVDFVSRFFGPQIGIEEDPVTGSAHTSLLPIWAAKLEKTHFTARQLSKRGGHLVCEYKGDRSIIGGEARLYLSGEIFI